MFSGRRKPSILSIRQTKWAFDPWQHLHFMENQLTLLQKIFILNIGKRIEFRLMSSWFSLLLQTLNRRNNVPYFYSNGRYSTSH